MVKSVFTFGQRGGFYFECPSEWQYAGLPLDFQALHTEKKIAAVHCACLGARTSYIVSYKGKDGLQYLASSGIPEQLRSWLYEKDSTGVAIRDFENVHISLGPYNESWFAMDGLSSRWCNLPSGLDTALEERRKPGGGWIAAPRLVSLGVGGNYIMLTDSGGGAWQLNNYKWLDSLIDQMRDEDIGFENIETISLNAYRLQNAVFQSKNGITYWTAMQHNAESAIASIEEATQKDVQRLQQLEGTRKIAEQNAQQQQLLQQLRNMRRIQNAQNIASMVSILAGLTLNGPTGVNMGMFDTGINFGYDSSAFWDPIQDAASMPIQ